MIKEKRDKQKFHSNYKIYNIRNFYFRLRFRSKSKVSVEQFAHYLSIFMLKAKRKRTVKALTGDSPELLPAAMKTEKISTV